MTINNISTENIFLIKPIAEGILRRGRARTNKENEKTKPCRPGKRKADYRIR